jgi:Tfp pilus assembly protein PilN
MFTIDLLKGQGIPARSRPEGIFTMAVTVIVPVVVAITMMGIYFSNRIVINIQKREISNYEQKIAGLSDAMSIHKKYERHKDLARQRISETAEAIDMHEQWSEILETVAENIPDSLILKSIAVEQRTAKIKVPDAKNPKKKVDKSVPARVLNLTLGGVAGQVSDDAVRNFRDRLRFSSVLGPKLEDIPVSQDVEEEDGKEIITYEMKCILKPRV